MDFESIMLKENPNSKKKPPHVLPYMNLLAYDGYVFICKEVQSKT